MPVGIKSTSRPRVPHATVAAVVSVGASAEPQPAAYREIAHPGRAAIAAGQMSLAAPPRDERPPLRGRSGKTLPAPARNRTLVLQSYSRTRQNDAHRQEPRQRQAVGKLAEEWLDHRGSRAGAKTRPAAAVYEKPRSATRNGSRAGTTPWQKSIRKWPMDRKAMARLFISRSLAGSDHLGKLSRHHRGHDVP